MNGPGHNSGIARDQLRSIVERVERIEEEIKACNDDKRDVYGEAKMNGFDTRVLKKIIQDRRKDGAERIEFNAIYDTYAAALGMIEEPDGTEYATRVHAHETPRRKRKQPVSHPADAEVGDGNTGGADVDDQKPAATKVRLLEADDGLQGAPGPSSAAAEPPAPPEIPQTPDQPPGADENQRSEPSDAASPVVQNDPPAADGVNGSGQGDIYPADAEHESIAVEPGRNEPAGSATVTDDEAWLNDVSLAVPAFLKRERNK